MQVHFLPGQWGAKDHFGTLFTQGCLKAVYIRKSQLRVRREDQAHLHEAWQSLSGGKFLPLLSPSISPSVNCPTYAIREVRLRQRTTVSWLIPPHQEPPALKNQTRIFFIEFDPFEASQVPRQIGRGLTLPDHSLCSIERKPCFIS